MSTPKHRTFPGSSYFVTTKCWQGRTIFQVNEIAEILLQTLDDYRQRGAYLLHEFVLMPDHLHLLLTPGGTTSLEKAVQLIKGGSSHRIHKKRNQEMEIWQQGFYDWTIRDAHDWQSKVEYIRMNPVRAGLVTKPEEWPYSSATGKFVLDTIPGKYLQTSGAKAPPEPAQTPGLKPRPPKEKTALGRESSTLASRSEMRGTLGLKPRAFESADVGAKAPTPGAPPNVSGASGAKAPLVPAQTPGLKPRHPKEKTASGPEGSTLTSRSEMRGTLELKPRPAKEKHGLPMGSRA